MGGLDATPHRSIATITLSLAMNPSLFQWAGTPNPTDLTLTLIKLLIKVKSSVRVNEKIVCLNLVTEEVLASVAPEDFD